jgi:hypothetical protein
MLNPVPHVPFTHRRDCILEVVLKINNSEETTMADVKDQVKEQVERTKQIETRLTDLKNVNRLASNAINLINDIEIKGAYAGPVLEIVQWIEGIKKAVQTQIDALEPLLPKVEESKVVEAEVVK